MQKGCVNIYVDTIVLNMEKTVLNLSKIELTKDQLAVLSKGLNFCPTPDEPDPGQYKIDLDSLHRRLRLRARFCDPDLLTDDSDLGPNLNIEGGQSRRLRLLRLLTQVKSLTSIKTLLF